MDNEINIFPDMYWIKPQILLAGGRPLLSNSSNELVRLDSLVKLGIRSFIDLTSKNEFSSYSKELECLSEKHKVKLVYSRFPIFDMAIPSIIEANEIVKLILENEKIVQPTYIHCKAGIGRTGTIIGCYLIETGIPRNGVFDKISELRQNVSTKNYSSPYQVRQKKFILSWKL